MAILPAAFSSGACCRCGFAPVQSKTMRMSSCSRIGPMPSAVVGMPSEAARAKPFGLRDDAGQHGQFEPLAAQHLAHQVGADMARPDDGDFQSAIHAVTFDREDVLSIVLR